VSFVFDLCLFWSKITKLEIFLEKKMKKIILVLVMFSMNAFALKIGDKIPAVTGVNQEGKTVKLEDLKKNYMLVYFYPKADTPGCTKQACSIRDSFAMLQKKGVTVLGVSTDDVAAQKAFKEKYKLPFDLIADTSKTWANAFEVGLTMGFVSRQAFLYKDGSLVWLDRTASTAEQARDVLDFIK
jgi:peroxiredoxin Q/BCP